MDLREIYLDRINEGELAIGARKLIDSKTGLGMPPAGWDQTAWKELWYKDYKYRLEAALELLKLEIKRLNN